MTAIVTRGDAANLHLPDETVDLVVTSPPYFGLRSYQDGGEHYAGQVGDEATPAEYLDALIACTSEWMRVLKPGGSIFVNLGDKYAADNRGSGGDAKRGAAKWAPAGKAGYAGEGFVRQKSLMLLPQRYAIRCIDELGLILRAEIVWSKPNGLPESVTDRVRRSHEQVFHFVKQPRYYSAVDEVREAHGDNTHAKRRDGAPTPRAVAVREQIGGGASQLESWTANPLGKLPGSVWTIPTSPLKVPASLGIDHFAAYPPELVRRIVLGWSPRGTCSDCGFLLGSTYDKGVLGVRAGSRGHATGSAQEVLLKGVRQSAHGAEQEVDDVPALDDARLCGGLEADAPDGTEVGLLDGAPAADGRAPRQASRTVRGGASQERDQDGQPDRELGATRQGRARPLAEARAEAVPLSALRRPPTDLRDLLPCPHCGGGRAEPAVIVDPFGGTGTTALVASCHGRVGISVDLSADYCRLARWRTTDPGERARVLKVARPAPVHEGQLGMFEELA